MASTFEVVTHHWNELTPEDQEHLWSSLTAEQQHRAHQMALDQLRRYRAIARALGAEVVPDEGLDE